MLACLNGLCYDKIVFNVDNVGRWQHDGYEAGTTAVVVPVMLGHISLFWGRYRSWPRAGGVGQHLSPSGR